MMVWIWVLAAIQVKVLYEITPFFIIEADLQLILFLVLFWFIPEKSPPNASQLKESMDLYEEIVTEEQRSREASYTEVSCHVLHASFFCFDLS